MTAHDEIVVECRHHLVAKPVAHFTRGYDESSEGTVQRFWKVTGAESVTIGVGVGSTYIPDLKGGGLHTRITMTCYKCKQPRAIRYDRAVQVLDKAIGSGVSRLPLDLF